MSRRSRMTIRSLASRARGAIVVTTLFLIASAQTTCAPRPAASFGPGAGVPTPHPTRPPLVMTDPAPMPGPVLPIGDSFLKIGVCADNIVRVAYARDPAFFTRGTLATAGKRCVPTPFKVSDEPDGKRVTTATLAVHIAPQGTVLFFDAQA